MSEADIHFYFDPVCPFAWMTSKWVRLVQSQREYTVDWRFISLRQINAHVDYDTHFPPEYEAGHTAGLRLLRVLERTRQEHGREMVCTLYAALGARIFDSPPPTEQDRTGTVSTSAEQRPSSDRSSTRSGSRVRCWRLWTTTHTTSPSAPRPTRHWP